MELRYHEVFVPGGFPRYTYNPRVGLQLEDRLSEVRRNLCKLVTITGQTKSGKTVLARKIIPQEESIWVDGGTVAEENDFWHVVIDGLSLFQEVSDEAGTEAATSTSGKVSGGFKLFGWGGTGEAGAEFAKGKSNNQGKTRTLSSRVVALKGLRDVGCPLVIDDFHYLPKELQGTIVRALKPLIFDGLPVVIIAIPHRRYDAIKVEKEMTGRIHAIDIPVWSQEELTFIPRTGFDLLNYDVEQPVLSKLADEAIGSPHLVQEFCRGLSKQLGIDRADATRYTLAPEQEEIERVFKDVATTIGRPIFDKLARGPRQRTDRMQRELKDGKTVDIYQLVLHALAHLKPGLVSLEYEDLRTAIRNVSATQIPQLQEVARVLKHMATIASTDQSSTPVIDFEEDEKKLHVTDPFFAFFLRWGDLA